MPTGIRPFHARYPFLAESRAAVEAADADLTAVVREEEAVVARAVDRVERAIEGDGVGDTHRSPRVELLSYPVARVLVSLVDQPVLTRKYARAEARTARTRFEEAFGDGGAELRSVERERLTLDALLAEFDLAAHVRETADGYAVDVEQYLELAAGVRGEEWRLVHRTLADGRVPVDAPALSRLLEEAVHDRVASGLPLSVPDAVADPLADRVAAVEETLADLDLTREIDTVVPELFPPCMQALLDRVQQGDHLEHHSRFAITAFLATIGLTTDEIVDLYRVNPGFGEEMTRYQTDHIRGASSPTAYTPPSCATMQSYGDCVNKDDLCDHISHPLAYYEAKLDDADEDDLEDWREREAEAE